MVLEMDTDDHSMPVMWASVAAKWGVVRVLQSWGPSLRDQGQQDRGQRLLGDSR